MRFLRRTSDSLAEADAALEAELGKSARFVRVSPYYSADYLSPYETKTVENLNRAFGSIFTASLLRFVPAKAFVADDEAALRTLRNAATRSTNRRAPGIRSAGRGRPATGATSPRCTSTPNGHRASAPRTTRQAGLSLNHEPSDP